MKKIITPILTAALLCSMATTAFAANPIESVTAGSNSDSAVVKGTYVTGSPSTTVYSVDVAWDSMEFTYTAGSAGTWNPETHAYTGVTAGSWSETKNTITVTNHSNVAVDAALSYTAESAFSAITGTFAEASGTSNDNKLELATAVGTEVANAPSATAELKLSGALASGTTNTKIGTVTVTISNHSANDSGEGSI